MKKCNQTIGNMSLGNYEISISRLLVVALIFLVYLFLSLNYLENVWLGGNEITRMDRIHSESEAKCILYHKSEKAR